jgi:hypothetical protein
MVYNTPAGELRASNPIRPMRKQIGIALLLTIAALSFRLFLALRLPNDDDDDGRYYALIARNVLNHNGYSGEEEEPFLPTLVRTPGYPLFLAGVYQVFGQDNNRAVRVIQAALDTATCWLVALLALYWSPVEWEAERRRRVMLWAFALAAVCPFTAIYVSTILTETSTMLLATAFALAATPGLGSRTGIRQARAWMAAGILGGVATMFRPDSALFVGGAGVALMLISGSRVIARPRDVGGERYLGRELARTFGCGLLLVIGFTAVLTPWTVRNLRVFGIFQPVAPLYANNPNEFAPVGYIAWLRTWVDDERYVVALEDGLDLHPLNVDEAPPYAFDLPEERARVAELYERYNHFPAAGSIQSEDADAGGDDGTSPEVDESEPEQFVRMTPDIDAEFAQIAGERVARHPLRYYVGLPLRRAISLWFDTHSEFYPFQGRLFPLADLDVAAHQHYWLPAFAVVLLIYTLLAWCGAWVMWANAGSRRWLLLLLLLIVPRLAFLCSQEHPEGRYVVEFFPFVAAAGGIALSGFSLKSWRSRASEETNRSGEVR